jgi:hypothetical protein
MSYSLGGKQYVAYQQLPTFWLGIEVAVCLPGGSCCYFAPFAAVPAK